jgi:hypothetical protein
MFSSGIAIAGALVIGLTTMLVFIGFVWGILRFFVWLWARIPSKVVSIQDDQLEKTLGILLAIALFPDVASYGLQVIQRLAIFIAEFISNVGLSLVPPSCYNDTPSCPSDFARGLASLLGSAATSIVSSLKLASFPISSFLWFLLASVIVTQVIGFVRRAAYAGRIDKWYVPAPVLRQRFAFAVLVIGSFYLGLSALLAIPLFQEKSSGAQPTADALYKALEANIMTQADFDRRFPEKPPKLQPIPPDIRRGQEVSAKLDTKDPISPTLSDVLLAIFDTEVSQRQNRLDRLEGYLATVRSAASNDPNSLREKARNMFSAGLQINEGKKQTAKHYYELIKWHQVVTRQKYDALTNCQDATNSYFTTAAQELNGIRTSLEANGQASVEVVIPVINRFRNTEGADDRFIAASNTCLEPSSGQTTEVPDRPSFSDTLGPVGGWTRWLLDPDQMPLVIIVGLVGFSLLGATVSRAVRNGPGTTITLDDLLFVIAGGTTAAVVVYLAAYGGLALLGNTGGDPNPYVVFVTCLVGAVYSEVVWDKARQSILKPNAQEHQTDVDVDKNGKER